VLVAQPPAQQQKTGSRGCVLLTIRAKSATAAAGASALPVGAKISAGGVAEKTQKIDVQSLTSLPLSIDEQGNVKFAGAPLATVDDPNVCVVADRPAEATWKITYG